LPDWAAIRRIAQERRREAAGPELKLERADSLVESALGVVGLWKAPAAHDDASLAGAQALLDRETLGIIYNADLPPETVAFNLAHELAHWWLHDESQPCHEPDIVEEPVAEPLPYGESYVSGYSPAQRRETEANIFAAAFLLPAPLLRACFAEGMEPEEIARRVGLHEGMVLAQMADALLQPEAAEAPPEAASPIRLDDSQRAAAEVESGPVLVVAGPGTGKTRTLVGRVLHLLETGTPPERILALTFSNKAAAEMRERVAAVAPDAARKLWMGTFHSFGLELLRRFGTRIGLPPRPALLDPLDAIALLERHLPDLNLRELEYLHNPIFPFRDILGAISRAKDELIAPEEFDAIVRRMSTSTADQADEAAVRSAARLREVAGVYAEWQRILQREGLLDFGDLIMRAVELLRTHPDVRRQVRDEYTQILVDEYQDINRASALLVKEVAGDGRGLWAVGDLRQAIYGFRGAAPANVTQFGEDYPGAREMTLDVNYRSRAPIVQLFAHAARHAPGWESLRGHQDEAVVYAEAADESAQAAGIAGMIRAYEQRGIALHDQAVLCRTNSQAEKMAAALEELGIPVVYLGDLFSRPEVRDLLALLSLACEGHGQGLLRAAAIPEYAATEEEVTAVLDRAQSRDLPFPGALRDCGVEPFERLHAHLAPLAYKGNAFSFFTRYLFGPARYLRDLLADPSVTARQRVLAIHQLLLLARAHAQRLDPADERPQRAFLDHVRRLVSTQEDSRARVPAGAEGIEGVRLLTIHASKGLEFPVIFLPNLAKDLFPSRARSGMIALPGEIDSGRGAREAAEDERLFFVALSRARDHLILSRPLTINGKPRDPSPLLALIWDKLEGVVSGQWSVVSSQQSAVSSQRPTTRHPTPNTQHPIPNTPVDVSLPELEQYMRCPRQYYYERVLRLPKAENPGLYRSLIHCLREAARWVRAELAAGRTVESEALDAKLTEIWDECAQRNEADHAHADLFRARAREMAGRILVGAAREPAVRHVAAGVEELAADFPAGRVRIRVDHAVESEEGGLSLERYDSGRPGDKDHTDPRLALIRKAAKAERPGQPVDLQIRYLSTGETKSVPEQPRYEPARVAKYESALEGIRDGDFTPNPSPDNCPGCPFFFVCPR
jgi:superfamily I DNA/RNA helicase/Zn-dependent peptidase ImmA (M78 family)